MRHRAASVVLPAALFLLVLTGGCAAGGPGRPAPLAGARQLVVVRTAGWTATTGWLRRYDRVGTAPWRAVGDSIPVVVGQGGLGWGRGVREAPEPGEPAKREGDRRAPAGEFQLAEAFGYAPPDSVSGLRILYVQATPALRCVDDPASTEYNHLITQPSDGPASWSSAEEMRRHDDAYRWGVVVEHNRGWQRQAGAGSCIFLHVWRGPDSATVGCTAMDETRLLQILRWLDGTRTPVLVQLPEPVYARVRADWDLP